MKHYSPLRMLCISIIVCIMVGTCTSCRVLKTHKSESFVKTDSVAISKVDSIKLTTKDSSALKFKKDSTSEEIIVEMEPISDITAEDYTADRIKNIPETQYQVNGKIIKSALPVKKITIKTTGQTKVLDFTRTSSKDSSNVTKKDSTNKKLEETKQEKTKEPAQVIIKPPKWVWWSLLINFLLLIVIFRKPIFILIKKLI